MNRNHDKLPLIGFILSLNDYGEAYPLVSIAKKYIELGGEAILFGHGTKYQDLVEKSGCKLILLDYDICEYYSKKLEIWTKKHQETNWALENYILNLIYKKNYECDINNINKQVELFKEKDVKLIVDCTGFNSFLSNFSARLANIPLVRIVSGAGVPPYYQQNLATFPDNYENLFFRLIPNFIKNRLTNWYILTCKSSVKEYNKLAEAYNLPKINRFLDICSADHVIVAEDIDFLKLNPTTEFPKKNFVGPFLSQDIKRKKEEQFEYDIKKHLQRKGNSILLTMGSSIVSKKPFLRILETLNQTDYNVIATYTTILNDNELPALNDNILLKKFIPNISTINQEVDLAIIHGGRGTVYTSAYSAKPAICIPFHVEQQCNIDNFVRHGSAIKLSKNFSIKKLLLEIEKIFTNYDVFLKNAQSLKEKLQEPNGSENTVKRLIEIINEEIKEKDI